jgi:hypothetical protein
MLVLTEGESLVSEPAAASKREAACRQAWEEQCRSAELQVIDTIASFVYCLLQMGSVKRRHSSNPAAM